MTIVEQSMSLQGPLGSIRSLPGDLNRKSEHATHCSITTRPPTSLKTREFVTNNNMVIIPHPPYLPDLASCDFAFVSQIENETEGMIFGNSDSQRELQAVLNSIKENDFHGAFEAWRKLWDRHTRCQGDYFEGDGNQN
jgi:hypothetical protein